MGICICSVFGHDALGITGGKTDNNSNGNVPEILGLGVFPVLISADDSSITISGWMFREIKFVYKNRFMFYLKGSRRWNFKYDWWFERIF
jgi:hypothetical protein